MQYAMLSATHAPAMAALYALSFPHGWSAEEIAHMLDVPGTLATGLMDGATLCAMLMLRDDGEQADILTLAVHPDQRRQGLAQQLFLTSLPTLKARGVKQVTLEVSVVNNAAIMLYRQLDFVETSRRAAYYRQPDGTRADALIMQRAL